ncbi:hypothetical protein SDRG_02831 [Saprolegnia diclina VS20]|uniref:Uncharacterized protein n=1 Tax=Saprolegnia diclina (strain VS20) TaxID=1156394 RepID=T0S4Z9_SAPDV|nr:hypothetical protein SDRG_02831 [Saprolegnia diclina VS20]EQC40183.1 hypothetical protein SDRG_02831 [Saprolegnia diclina VS20]|eukprot:XP_008606657.1 hypothetical protein SDRG_02831 [Saprolegnia diclina VS20]
MALANPQTLALSSTVVTHFKQDATLQMTREDQDYEYVMDCKTTASKDHVILALSDKTLQARSRSTLTCDRVIAAHNASINEVCVSETSPWCVLSGSNDGTMKLWDLRTDQGPAQSIRVGSEVWTCSMGCGDTLVVCGTNDRAVFYDTRTARKLGEYGESHMDNVTRVRFHPLRRSEVVTASEDGVVCLFDCTIADEDDAIISIINVESAVTQFAFFGHELHNMAFLTGSETLDLWNITTAQRLAHFPQIRDACNALHMPTEYLIDCKYDATSDQLHLVTGDHAGTVNIATLGESSLTPQAKLVGGHKTAVRCIDWDDNMLLTGGEDSRLCKWSASSGLQQQATRGIRASVERDVSGLKKARNSSRPY